MFLTVLIAGAVGGALRLLLNVQHFNNPKELGKNAFIGAVAAFFIYATGVVSVAGLLIYPILIGSGFAGPSVLREFIERYKGEVKPLAGLE